MWLEKETENEELGRSPKKAETGMKIYWYPPLPFSSGAASMAGDIPQKPTELKLGTWSAASEHCLQLSKQDLHELKS